MQALHNCPLCCVLVLQPGHLSRFVVTNAPSSSGRAQTPLSVRGRARAPQAGPPLAMRRRWNWVHEALRPALGVGRAWLVRPWLLLHHFAPLGQP
jgi:hypothetical protein